MNVPLLITACSIATSMVGMERWASWRLSVAQKRMREAAGILPDSPADARAPMVPEQAQDPDLMPSYLSGLHGGMTDA